MKQNRIVIAIILFENILLVTGALFRILHWPGDNAMLYTALSLVVLTAFYFIYRKLKKVISLP